MTSGKWLKVARRDSLMPKGPVMEVSAPLGEERTARDVDGTRRRIIALGAVVTYAAIRSSGAMKGAHCPGWTRCVVMLSLVKHQRSGADGSLGDVLDIPKAVRKKPVAGKATPLRLETIAPRNAREDWATQTVGGGEQAIGGDH